MSAINTPTTVQGNHSLTVLTDHYSVLLGIDLSEKKLSCNSESVLNYRKLIYYSELKNILAEESWEQIYDCESRELAADKQVEKFNHYLALSTVKIKIRKENIKRKPWVTKGLMTSVSIKNELYRQLRINLCDENLKDRYKRNRNF
ncbi:hypothetical protein HHI36_010443 [Cryptolaemus montrouzieri]|uniref:Uncharacterized protein n=1 Tax=Cryptolaemus montrouzieri TaxID=559131 RepID=A0ABD2MIS9_9CUCU